MTLRGYLDASYALVIETASAEGISPGVAREHLEEKLAEPLADEVTPMELEMLRRKKIAMENERARGQMGRFMEMERARG